MQYTRMHLRLLTRINHRCLASTVQTAASLLDQARKMSPSYGEAFMLFVREREVSEAGDGWEEAGPVLGPEGLEGSVLGLEGLGRRVAATGPRAAEVQRVRVRCCARQLASPVLSTSFALPTASLPQAKQKQGSGAGGAGYDLLSFVEMQARAEGRRVVSWRGPGRGLGIAPNISGQPVMDHLMPLFVACLLLTPLDTTELLQGTGGRPRGRAALRPRLLAPPGAP